MFDQEWFDIHQNPLLKFANTAFGRYILRINGKRSQVGNHEILEINPNSITWKDIEGNFVTEFRVHNKFSKRLYYGLKPFWHIIHLWDMNVANILQPAWNLGFDTLTTRPVGGLNSPTDGHVARQYIDEQFDQIHDRAGNDSDVIAGITVIRLVTGPAGFSGLFRSGFCFNTSKISQQGKISAATLSLYGDARFNTCGNSAYNICGFNPAAYDMFVASDYGNFESTSFASVSFGSFVTSGYNSFSLNAAGIAEIKRSGITAFGGRLGWDLDNSSSGFTRTNNGDFSGYYVKSADTTGESQDPTLVVTYKKTFILASELTSTSTSSSTSTTTTSTTSSTTSTSTTTTSSSTTTTSTTTTSSSTTTTSSSTTTTSSSTTTTSTTTTFPLAISVDSGS